MTIRIKQRSVASVTIGAVIGALVVTVPSPASAATVIIDLGTLPGGILSFAEDINDAGIVVGGADSGPGVTHAVRWNSRGVITDLGTLPGHSTSYAFAINDAGTIIGASNGRPVRWTSAGTIVGRSSHRVSERDTEQHAVRWDSNGGWSPPCRCCRAPPTARPRRSTTAV